MSTKKTAKPQSIAEQRALAEILGEAFETEPKDVNGQFNLTTNYYFYELLNIVKGRLDIRCPDFWNKDFMLDSLILQGRFFITDSAIGIAPFNGNPNGLNVFNRASQVEIVNSILGTWKRWITGTKMNKKDACVVYLYDNLYYRSAIDMLRMYSQRLASIDCSFDVNIMNTRVAFIFNVNSTQQEKEAKKVYSKVSKGEPAVFTKVKDTLHPDDGGLDVQAFPAKDVFIADKLIETKRSVMAEFLTKWGVNNTAYEKRERLTNDEVNSNNVEIDANVAYIRDNLALCSEKVRNMFNIDFDIKLKESSINVEVKPENTNKENNI